MDQNGSQASSSPLRPQASMKARPAFSASKALEQGRIVIVDSDHLVAVDIAQAFEEAGAQVIGTASSAGTALALIARAGRLDGAVLDISLQGGTASCVADELVRRGVPFLFATACSATAIPPRFAHITRCEKPFDTTKLVPLLLTHHRVTAGRTGDIADERLAGPRS